MRANIEYNIKTNIIIIIINGNCEYRNNKLNGPMRVCYGSENFYSNSNISS